MRALGDSHNFGRRVTRREGVVHKPRTLLWEQLLLSRPSPLRRALEAAAPGHFDFLPDLRFAARDPRGGGEVEALALAPLPDLDAEARRELARITGRFAALFAWLGVSDLHWENLALGAAPDGRTILAPLDVEAILADLALPTETQFLPAADPDLAPVLRHAAGVRRVLPYLGKPVTGGDLAAMAGAYRATLDVLDRHARAIADAIAGVEGLREAPIRVLLRGTDEYVGAPAWPLLPAERAQLARGDVPYFFRRYGEAGLFHWTDPELRAAARVPEPRLEPLLSLSRGLRAEGRASLRAQGLFTLFGALDHPSLDGVHEADGIALTFRKRRLVIELPDGEELDARRDLSGVVQSVYLPCRCGEVRTPLVPATTTCEAR